MQWKKIKGNKIHTKMTTAADIEFFSNLLQLPSATEVVVQQEQVKTTLPMCYTGTLQGNVPVYKNNDTNVDYTDLQGNVISK